MIRSPKFIYAQSSDIKSRTFVEYRRDMKVKAIAELEFMPLLQQLLAVQKGDPKLVVEKHGADAELWFRVTKGPSREPDYRAQWKGNQAFLYEFQYANDSDSLTHFDFKISKVAYRGVPHTDREFFYIDKLSKRYAFITPQWILNKGKKGPVPAWGSRQAYRVPRDKLIQHFKPHPEIATVFQEVDDKNCLLKFQHEFLSDEASRLSHKLQEVIENDTKFEVTPRTLKGFFEVCFFLERLNKPPSSPSNWLNCLTAYFKEDMTSYDLARFMFALDYLYFQCQFAKMRLNEAELRVFVGTLKKVAVFTRNYPLSSGWYSDNPQISESDQTRHILFAANLLEDLIQDVAVHYRAKGLAPVGKIFDRIPDVPATATQIRSLRPNP